jgi:hypothetical protein
MKKFHKTSKYNYNLFKNYLITNQTIFLYSVKNIKREVLYKTRQQLNEKNIKLMKINNIISQKLFINQLNKKNFYLFQSENLIGFTINTSSKSIKNIKEIIDLKLTGISLIGVIINKKLIIPINLQNDLKITHILYKNLYNTINYLVKFIISSTINKPKFFLLPIHFSTIK